MLSASIFKFVSLTAHVAVGVVSVIEIILPEAGGLHTSVIIDRPVWLAQITNGVPTGVPSPEDRTGKTNWNVSY